jgi:hypothetical protein
LDQGPPPVQAKGERVSNMGIIAEVKTALILTENITILPVYNQIWANHHPLIFVIEVPRDLLKELY